MERKSILLSILLLSFLVLSAGSANALVLTRGTPAVDFTGNLGTVQVNYVADAPTSTGGLIDIDTQATFPGVPIERVQYDVYNTSTNFINEFTVTFPAGTVVESAYEPLEYYDSILATTVPTGGTANATVFNNGYGTYHYNSTSSWEIEYQSTYVTFRWVDNGTGLPGGLPSGAVAGYSDVPTTFSAFAIEFQDGTFLGLQPASFTNNMVPVLMTATGSVLSADSDTDGDGVGDSVDNCPFIFNPEQNDVCSACIGQGGDTDSDGICDNEDNCRYDFNPEQENFDGDELGDVCEQDKGISLTETIQMPIAPIPAGALDIPVTSTFVIEVTEPIRMFRIGCDTMFYEMTNSLGEDIEMRDIQFPALGIPTDLVDYNSGDTITLTCNLGDHVSPELLTADTYLVRAFVTLPDNDPNFNPITKDCLDGGEICTEENEDNCDCEGDIFVGLIGSTPSTLTVSDAVGATLVLQADQHTVGFGPKQKPRKKGFSGMEVRLFAKGDGTCASGYGNSWHSYPDIWNNCPAFATRFTDASGQAIFAPISTAYDYIVIGKYIATDENEDEYTLYGGSSAGDLLGDIFNKIYIQFIATADGEKVPAKYKKIPGS